MWWHCPKQLGLKDVKLVLLVGSSSAGIAYK